MGYLAICTMTAALVLASGATGSAQSLADISRQEEERRKAVGTTSKVYTNERLRPEPVAPGAPAAPATVDHAKPAAAPAPGISSSGGDVKPGDPAAGTSADPATEDAWRKRVATEREAVTRSQMFAEALQSQINGLNTEFENRSDPAQRSVIGANRQKALAELDRVKKELQERQKAITAIQDEARRTGIPAGWTR